MIIETKKFKDVNRAPYNPRVELMPGMPEYEKLAKSIHEYGHILPLVFNARTGVLVGGHQTMSVLEADGITEAQMSVVDLDEIQEKACNIALNKTGGSWDDDKLSSILGELSAIPDFDIELTGFETYELPALDIEIPSILEPGPPVSEPVEDADGTLNIQYDTKDGGDDPELPEEPAEAPVSNAKKREAKRHVDPDTFDVYCVAFSGGKDSALLALWALERYPAEKIWLKYWDSGWNYPEESKYVHYFAEKYGLNLILAGYKNNDTVIKIMREKGYPFYGNLWCQSRMKAPSLNRVHKYMLENISDNILSLVGIRKSESRKRSDYPEFSKQGGETLWYPIRDYTDDDLIEYFKENGEKVIPLYKFTDRTGCVFCPNANVSSRQFLKEQHPEEMVKINECIVEALQDKRWAATHLIDTLKLFNRKRTTEPKDFFKDIAYTFEEFDKIVVNTDKINIIDLRESEVKT